MYVQKKNIHRTKERGNVKTTRETNLFEEGIRGILYNNQLTNRCHNTNMWNSRNVRSRRKKFPKYFFHRMKRFQIVFSEWERGFSRAIDVASDHMQAWNEIVLCRTNSNQFLYLFSSSKTYQQSVLETSVFFFRCTLLVLVLLLPVQ